MERIVIFTARCLVRCLSLLFHTTLLLFFYAHAVNNDESFFIIIIGVVIVSDVISLAERMHSMLLLRRTFCEEIKITVFGNNRMMMGYRLEVQRKKQRNDI